MPDLDHLTDYLEHNARTLPDKPALVCADRTLTWGELGREVSAACGEILRRVPAREQRIVSLLLPNSWQFIVAYLGILKAGHIALPLDIVFKPLEIAAITDQLPPDLTITDQAHRASFANPSVITFEDIAAGTSDHPQPLRLDAKKQIASMLFTSGTTGRPKATPYTHDNHLWNIATASKLYEWTAEDTILLSLPLSHWHGLVMGVSGMLYHGNTVYLQERLDPEAALTAMASGKISLFMHVSLAYAKLVQHAPEKAYDLSGVRLCISASSALPPSVWHEFKGRFGIEILERCGSSEAGQIASNTLTDRLPGSPGRAIPGTELKVNDRGELMIKTPGLFPGYWNNPEATAKGLLPGGWWLTGDIAEFDEQGHVFLKGRTQETIKKLGYRLSPRDLEWALQTGLPAVKEVFVMGRHQEDNPDDLIAYFVVGEAGEAEIRAFCKEQMPSAWRPDRVIVLEAIPRTRSGKPILAELRAMLE